MHHRHPILATSALLAVGFSGHLEAQTAATPVLTPSTATTSYVQFNVTLTDSTTGATIYYTANGTAPTTSSASVAPGGTVLITQSETLKAMAVASGYTNSAVASAIYQVTGQVVSGEYHTVALRSDGSVWAWGYNIYGEVGDGTTTQRNSAVQISSPNSSPTVSLNNVSIVAVAAGAYHSLALTSGGNVYAWGLNSSGQCGDNTTTERTSPVLVQKSNGSGGTTPLNNIIAICAGGYHNLALDSNFHVWVWGLDSKGQLGDGGTTQQNMAEELTTTMPTGVTVQQLYAGAYHSLLLGMNSTGPVVYAWGLNTNGQVGDGTVTQRDSPVLITFSGLGSNSITGLAAGAEHSVALASDHSVWTWGYNSSGQLGNNSTTQADSPVHLSSFGAVTAVAAGYTHTLALVGGAVWAWGSNAAGELGDGTSIERNSPVQALNISGAVLPTAGNEDTLVLKNDGTLWVNGANNCGQMGDGVSIANDNAQQILGLTPSIKQIATGCAGYHALALDNSNNVWAWGNDANGQLGNGTNLQQVNPAQVSFSGLGSATITSVAANGNRSLALDSNSTVWSWGQGDIGNGTTSDSNQPVHLTGSSGWGSTPITAISEGLSFGMALDSGNHVWTWGTNTYGQLGNNTTTSSSTPVEVLSTSGSSYLANVTAISGGDNHALALIGGAVYAWGDNAYGELGDGTTTNRTRPVLVNFTGLGGATITAISGGYGFSAAIDSNQHVWAWGDNANAELGIGNTNPQTAPVEVLISGGAPLSNVVAVHCGECFCTALKSDGTVWCWGWNSRGELGNGTLTTDYRTVQAINLSGISALGSGYLFSFALKQDGSLQSWGYDGTGAVGVQANYASPFAIPGFNGVAATSTPTVSITAPSNNATVAMGSSQTFTASASETGGTIASVSYYVNSTLIGTSTTGSSYSLNWTPPTYGNFTFTAIATDTNGHTSYLSSPVTVQVPYDSDGDGLPDWWEIKYFGNLTYGAGSDPDGNGFTLLQDYQAGANPTNYYSQPNGSGGSLTITPTLTISGGNSQTSGPSTFAPNPLAVTVTNSSGGALLANAPVTFTVVSGGGLVSATSGGTYSASLQVTTNASGVAQVYYQQPSGNNITSTISASTGGQTVDFTENDSEAPPSTGLALWFRADAGVTPDGNGNVGQWQDQSPNQFIATQSSSSAKPVIFTDPLIGKPALQFSGSQTLIGTGNTNITATSGTTIIGVDTTTAPADQRYFVTAGGTAITAETRSLGYYGSGQSLGVTYSDATAGSAPNAGVYVLDAATLSTDGSSVTFYRNGMQTSTATLSGSAAGTVTSGFSVGSYVGNAFGWKGNIAEVLVYNRVLSTAELNQASVYLADKYGLYDPNATWPSSYTAAVQAEITRNQWNKSQADAYVAFQAANPTMLTNGLKAWYKADALPTNSTSISNWADQTGNYTVTQSTPATQPTYVANDINGEPAVRFNGSQALYNPSSLGAGVNGDMTMISVGSTTNPGAQQYTAYLGNTGGYGNRGIGYYQSHELFDLSGGNYSLGGSAPNANTFVTEAWTLAPNLSSVTFYQNGIQTGTATMGSVQNVTPGLTVGGYNGYGTPWQGDIAEVLVYDHQLSTAELQQVGVYLANKYGLYNPNATWPSSYTAAVQAEITRNQWNKSQADAYVAFQAANPTMLTNGLKAWYKADALPTNSTSISNWADQTGNYTVTQSTPATQPTYVANDINGEPAVRFNGSQALYNPSSLGAGVNGDMTMISVGSTTNPGAQQYTAYLGNTGGYGNRGIGYYQSHELFDLSGGNYSLGGSAPNANTFVTEAWTLAPNLSSVTFYQNGIQTGTATMGSVQNVTPGLTVGGYNGYGTPWQGDIAEVLVYDHQLSTAELQQVGVYLANKYGFYNPNATWPSSYTAAVQAEIARHQWNKVQADSYVAFQANNPTMLTNGLTVWFRADDPNAVKQDGSGNVTAWNDETGNYSVQGTSGSEPTYVVNDLNGEPGLRFNGDQWLSGTANFGPGLNQDMTMITVGAASNSISNYALYLGSNASPYVNRAYLYYNGNEYLDGQYVGCSGGAAAASNTFAIETASLNSALTQVTFYQNGAQTGVFSASGTGAFQNLSNAITIGAATGGYDPWQGDIVEQLVYDHQLSSTEMAQVTQYLADKYGFFLNIAPTFSPVAGSYTSSQTVSIASSLNDSNRVIRYTLDGSEPTINSPIYTGPFTVASSALVQAAQFLNGQLSGPVASAQYTINGQGDLPVLPTNLTATSISGGETDLSWVLSGTVDYSAIDVYRSTNGGAYALVAILDPTASTYADQTVAVGNSYTYEVGTVNASGISDTSASSAVTPPSSTTLTITVTTPTGSGDGPLP